MFELSEPSRYVFDVANATIVDLYACQAANMDYLNIYSPRMGRKIMRGRFLNEALVVRKDYINMLVLLFGYSEEADLFLMSLNITQDNFHYDTIVGSVYFVNRNLSRFIYKWNMILNVEIERKWFTNSPSDSVYAASA